MYEEPDMSDFLILQHIGCEDLGTIEQAMIHRGISYKYVRLFDGDPVPKDFHKYSGLIILGGPMNVYEEDVYPYLKDEDILIKEAIKKQIPVLGICLGGQLIAKATGAKVRKGIKKEIGWYDLLLTPGGKTDRGFKNFPERLTVFQWHGDTFDIPSGATPLACSGLFPNQAFRFGNNIYGLQFHLEVTKDMINRWMAEYGNELSSLDYIDPEKIIKDTDKYIKTLSQHAEIFYNTFFSS